MNKPPIIYLPLITFFFLQSLFLPVKAQRTMRIMEWNVENVFDTLHDAGHDDWEFTPQGKYNWTSVRFWRKLNEIGKTILATGDTTGLPALVGLCEVENDTVMTCLTQRSLLRTAGYRYVMTDSPDRRGIDVALLYHPSQFRLISYYSVRIPSETHNFPPTRDLLYASGQVLSGDTLHVVVCHTPSKAGGTKNSTRHRRLVFDTLRGVVDSLFLCNPQAKLIVMGDFNSTPDESIFKKLVPPLCETLPTSRRELNRPVGTYFFQKRWSYLDHILLSPAPPPLSRAREARFPFLLDRDGRPNRIFKGTYYNQGISDHLPLYVDIVL